MNIAHWLALGCVATATAVFASDPVPSLDITQLRPPAAPAPALKPDSDPAWDRPAAASSQPGLKLPATLNNSQVIELPFGLNYHRDARSVLMPLDSKNEWGVGLNLDVNSSRAVELAPSASPLGLQPKRTPGVTLQKRF